MVSDGKNGRRLFPAGLFQTEENRPSAVSGQMISMGGAVSPTFFSDSPRVPPDHVYKGIPVSAFFQQVFYLVPFFKEEVFLFL